MVDGKRKITFKIKLSKLLSKLEYGNIVLGTASTVAQYMLKISKQWNAKKLYFLAKIVELSLGLNLPQLQHPYL